jgi:hypothetical protein
MLCLVGSVVLLGLHYVTISAQKSPEAKNITSLEDCNMYGNEQYVALVLCLSDHLSSREILGNEY